MTDLKSRLPKDTWIYLVFFALVCAFFYDILFLGKTLLTRDTFADFIPRLQFAGSAYRDFNVPLWNTQTGCGHPFFADPYMGAAYPLNAVFYVLPPAWAYRITLLFHFALAGFGMIALARHWKLRPSAALFAAIAFVFGTHTVAMAEFFNALFPLSWGPLIVTLTCVLYDRMAARPANTGWLRAALLHWKTVSALALSLALCYLAGNPQYLAFALLLAGAFLLSRFLYDRKPAPFLATTVIIGVAGVLSLLLVAPQLLPFLELLGESFRATAIDPGFNQGSVSPALLLTFLLPFLFGAPGGPDAHWAESILEYQLGAFYVGILPLMAAFFAIFAFRNPGASENGRWLRFLAIVLTVCAVGAILMAMGNHFPLYEFMLNVVPGLDKLRWPSKFMLLATYAVPLLGALGFHLLLERKAKEDPGSLALGWIVLALFLAFAAFLVAGGEIKDTFSRLVGTGVEVLPSRLVVFKRDLVTALVFIAAAVAAFTLLLKAPMHLRVLKWVIVAIAFINVAVIGRRVHPVTEENILAYEPKTWNTFQNMAVGDPHWRIYSAYAFDHFHLYGVSDPDVFKLARKASVGETWLPSGIPRVCNSALSMRRYYDFYEAIKPAPPEIAGKLMDIMNVRFVLSGPPWNELAAQGLDAKLTVYPRENPLPRAFLAGSWREETRFDDGLRTLASPEFDIHSEFLLGMGHRTPAPRVVSDPSQPVEGSVGALHYDWNRVEMQVDASRPCFLVLNDTWYRNWKATVNGNEEPVYRANLLFRAVPVPSGDSTVVFEYVDPAFRNGLVLAALGVALLGSGFFLRRRMVKSGHDSSR